MTDIRAKLSSAIIDVYKEQGGTPADVVCGVVEVAVTMAYTLGMPTEIVRELFTAAIDHGHEANERFLERG